MAAHVIWEKSGVWNSMIAINKRVVLVLGLLVSILVCLSSRHLLGFRKYETGGSRSTFRIAPFDEMTKAFLLERESKWSPTDSDHFALSSYMSAAGLAPSLRRLTNLLTPSTPKCLSWRLYRWLRPHQAESANILANMKGAYFEVATLYNTPANPTFQISDDGHLGLLWTGTKAVVVFQDGTNGFQEIRYRKKADASH